MKCIPKRCFEILESDTDSIYASFAKADLEDCVPIQLKESFYKDLFDWMPVETCETHKEEFINTKINGLPWNPHQCCKEAYEFQKRTPGLLKLEYRSDKAVCLSAKTHLFTSKNHTKQVSKSINLKTTNIHLIII